jgi:hypothetical protein
VLGADVMVSPGKGGLDVAKRHVHPAERCPLGRAPAALAFRARW